MSNAAIWNVTDEEYHADAPDSVSRSELGDYRAQPAFYYGRHVAKTNKRKPTADMIFGRLFHAFILEPEKVISVPPEVLSATGTRQGSAWKAFKEEHADAFLMTDKEMRQLSGMRSAMLHNPAAAKLLAPDILAAGIETAIRWTDDASDLALRCKIDILDLNFIADLKTTASAAPKEFARSIYTYGYHRQGAFYRRGVYELTGEWLPWILIASEKTDPWRCEVYDLDPEWLKTGMAEIKYDLAHLAKSFETRTWNTSTHGQITTLQEPRYAKLDIEYEM